jgi:hypothetical protein
VIDDAETTLLQGIFSDTYSKIMTAYNDKKLPMMEFSVLGHALGLAEELMIPILDGYKDNEEVYNMKLMAIAASFRWSIRRLMPFSKFEGYMKLPVMNMVDNVSDEAMEKKDGEDHYLEKLRIGFETEAKRRREIDDKDNRGGMYG